RQLVLLKCYNDVDTVVAYLACLSSNHPVLLVDGLLDEQLTNALIEQFEPNLICDGPQVAQGSDKVHRFNPELALLLSTSGSTGSAKLVMLSRDNIDANARSICQSLQLQSDAIAISSLPLHYSYGLSVLHSHLFCGGTMVMTDDSLMTRPFWQLFKQHQVSSLNCVTYLLEILEKLRFERMTLPSLKSVTHAGGKLSKVLASKFARWCEDKQAQLYLMYGQTEATARVSCLDPQLAASKPGSIGKAINGGKLSLIDDNEQPLEQPGDCGQLVYQGPNVMLGYAQEAGDLAVGAGLSAASSILKTGDIARFDQQGDFYIVGRLKRFIKLYGLRLNLDQIEQFLQQQGHRCFCGGNDEKLMVATLNEDTSEITTVLSQIYRINVNAISVFQIDAPVNTSRGKTDYQQLFGPLC
ncbi:MAG: AMP-binding protein, partial [Psychrosphaera sp.]|nr:AMP-binding protein [Psychrosphaera sp.]